MESRPAGANAAFAAYMDEVSPESRRAMRDSLAAVAWAMGEAAADGAADGAAAAPEAHPWHLVRYADSQRARARLVGRYAARTVNRHLSALRGVLRAAWRLGAIPTEEYHHARDVKNVGVHEPPAGRQLSLGELRAIVLGAPRKRDAALLCMLYAGGLRRIEVARLRVGNYSRATGQVEVRGKGNKVRQVTINAKWRGPIDAWLDEYDPRVNDPIFPRITKGGKVTKDAITEGGVSYAVEACRQAAGVPPFTPHDFRRTFITDLIEAGADLVVVQRIAGHANVNTTASYDRRGRVAETEAVGRLRGLEE